MLLNPATRFLKAELERIELELYRLESVDSPYQQEYRRRHKIICEIMPQAVTPDAAVAAVEHKLAVLAAAGDHDTITDVLRVDAEYLEGLLARLRAGIAEGTFPYALANVERL